MDYFIVTSILNALTSAWVCLFVILSNPKSKTSQSFAYYSFSVALWATFFSLFMITSNKDEALLCTRLATTCALFIPVTLLHFTCCLLNEYKKFSLFIKLSYAINLLLVPIGFTPLYLSHNEQQYIFPNWPIAGPLYIILGIQYFIGIGFSLLLIHKNIKITSGFKQQQLKHVFWGIIIAYLGGMTCFPLSYKILIPPIGLILIPFYTLFITYAIFRYQLMDIKIIFQKGLVYSTLITIITLLYFLSIYLTEHFFQEALGYKSVFISLILASIITLVFIPLKNIIQSFIEKHLFTGGYLKIAEENKLLREEIIQTEKLKSIAVLASGMAHEIKNPLTALKTFSEYLPQKMDDKEFLKKFAPIISREVDRIDALVHELLDFAKPAPLQLKPSNTNDLLNQTLEFLSNDFIKHKISVTKNFGLQNDLLLLLDINQFKQAILNILLNSIDAMPTGGELNIHTYPSVKSGHISIKIQDNGIGIPQEDMSHIFDPFFSKKDGGTGLGLSITHEIIKNHNGKIYVESKAGSGTAFIIELPYNSSL